MVVQLCNEKLEGYVKLLHFGWRFVLVVCVLNLLWAVVAVLGNVLVIRALMKAKTIPATLRPLFLSLAVSDLTVGLFAQLMFGVVMALMLKMSADGNFNLDLFCPSIVTISQLSLYGLVTASVLSVAAIAIDRASCGVTSSTIPRTSDAKKNYHCCEIIMDCQWDYCRHLHVSSQLQ